MIWSLNGDVLLERLLRDLSFFYGDLCSRNFWNLFSKIFLLFRADAGLFEREGLVSSYFSESFTWDLLPPSLRTDKLRKDFPSISEAVVVGFLTE